MNPSKSEFTALDKTVYPGEQAVFSIPITTSEANWKACWYLLSSSGESLYDFCYSHGNGANPSSAQSTQNTSAGSNSADMGSVVIFSEVKCVRSIITVIVCKWDFVADIDLVGAQL